jgi:hypothetical protein
MATVSLPHVGPALWTVIVETPTTTIRVPARDDQTALQAAWFQATAHAGHAYRVNIRIVGPGAALPPLTIPAANDWPEPEPEPWELAGALVEYEEAEELQACGSFPQPARRAA